MLFEQKIKLHADTHQYFHIETGAEYKPVSRVIDLVKNKFDKSIAKHCAGKGKYEGMDEQQVLDAWDAKAKNSSDWGTFLHESLEYYEKYKKYKVGSEKYAPIIQSVLAEYKEYKKIYQEVVLHNDEFMVAGTSDKPMLKTISKTSPIWIGDYKTNEKITPYNDYNKYLKGPLNYLQDCSYNTYGIQLSLYAYFLECLTKRKIGGLFLHHIPIDNPMHHKIIHVPYMRDAAIQLLKYNKETNGMGYIDDNDESVDLVEQKFEGEKSF